MVGEGSCPLQCDCSKRLKEWCWAIQEASRDAVCWYHSLIYPHRKYMWNVQLYNFSITLLSVQHWLTQRCCLKPTELSTEKQLSWVSVSLMVTWCFPSSLVSPRKGMVMPGSRTTRSNILHMQKDVLILFPSVYIYNRLFSCFRHRLTSCSAFMLLFHNSILFTKKTFVSRQQYSGWCRICRFHFVWRVYIIPFWWVLLFQYSAEVHQRYCNNTCNSHVDTVGM